MNKSQKNLFVSASGKILYVILSREIGNDPWFEHSKLSWCDVKVCKCEKQKQTLTRMNSALLIDEATKPVIPRIIPIIAII